MKSAFERILNGYERASTKEPLAGNELAIYIRDEAVQEIAETAKIDSDQYMLQGSPGQGRWAKIPWIAVFDRDISISASKGYDIVYLFAADMSGVYLSLNQGWTTFLEKYGTKNGLENIDKVSHYWRNELSSALDDFDTIEIELKTGRNKLARGYELGHICGKFYSADNFPDSDSMVNDLRNLLGVFRELKGKLAGTTIEEFNAEIVTDHELALSTASKPYGSTSLEKVDQRRTSQTASKLVENSENVEIVEQEPPKSIGQSTASRSMTTKKTDFEAKTKAQAKIGLAGEKAIVRHERNQLVKAGKQKLAKLVEHVSLKNDSAGYDILSFFPDGREHFIEVKSTVGPANEPFYISANEVEFSQNYPDQYSVYRVYAMNPDEVSWNYFRYSGSIRDHFQLSPMNFKATYSE